jgi:hypothetical protein
VRRLRHETHQLDPGGSDGGDEPQPSLCWRSEGATVHARASDIVAIETVGEALVDLAVKGFIHNDVVPGDYSDTPSFIDGLVRPGAYAEGLH